MDTTTEFWRDPAMPYVESRRACHSRTCYQAHSHPTFSIGAVDQGTSIFAGADSGPEYLQPGSLVLVPSAYPHACNPLPDTAWSYQMLHVDAAWMDQLCQESHLQTLTQVVVRHDATAYARFCQLNTLLFSDTSVDEKEAALVEFMGDCGPGQHASLAVPADTPQASQRMQPVLHYLEHERLGMCSLTTLAGLARLSRYQLIRNFRAATGMTPHAYQLNLCINRARAWLREGEALADVAYRLGFADQSHFQRVFKAHVGVTPGHYRGH